MTSRAQNRITGIGVALLSSCRGQFLFLGRAVTRAKEEQTCSNVKRALKSSSGAYSVLRLANSCESSPFKFDILAVPAFDILPLILQIGFSPNLHCLASFVSRRWGKTVAWWSLSVYALFVSGGFGILSFSCRNWSVHLLSDALQSPTRESSTAWWGKDWIDRIDGPEKTVVWVVRCLLLLTFLALALTEHVVNKLRWSSTFGCARSSHRQSRWFWLGCTKVISFTLNFSTAYGEQLICLLKFKNCLI